MAGSCGVHDLERTAIGPATEWPQPGLSRPHSEVSMAENVRMTRSTNFAAQQAKHVAKDASANALGHVG
jgi:hypothetical protein